ncbi:MAG: putative heme transporter [Thermoleophilaceae bacterium]|nr:putative heme transporter [Thermoleophilaceae bacterium]
MSAHAATHTDLFERDGSLRDSIDLRKAGLVALIAAVVIAALVTALPGAYSAVSDGFAKLGDADIRWLLLALGLEALSFLGHIVLFRGVFLDRSSRIGYGASYDVTLAGHAATRVFGAAGAGGIALTVWALNRSGMSTRTVATRMLGFMVLLYSFYALAVAAVGFGLWSGVLPGGGPLVLTLVPGIAALVLVGGAIGAAVVARRTLGAREDVADASGLRAHVVKASRAIGDGVREAGAVVRRRDPRLIGGVMWWAFDIAVLWASFRAFGHAPPVAIIVLAYFLGLVGNALPFLGSIGGVDGGMIAALVAFGANPAASVVAVIVYRLFSCWAPVVPGAVAFARLRRRVAAWQRADAGEAEPLDELAAARSRRGAVAPALEPVAA